MLAGTALPSEVLEENRRQWLTGIEEQRKEPGALVSNAISRHGNPYPRGDVRYAATFDEQVQDLQAVKLEALRAFHRRFVSAANGEFSAAGDMDAAAVRAALDAALGDWRAPTDGPQAFVRVPQPLQKVAPERFMLRTPDKQNANLLATLRLPLNDLHEDFVPMLVANHLFGTGGTGRLWLRIREKDGLSYGTYSGVAWNAFEPNSRWIANAIFAPQNQAKVEAAFREELDRSLKDGFTQQELDEARAGLLSSRRLARAQDGVVTGALAENLYLGRSFARSQQVDDQIAQLTLAQVNAAWRKYMDPTSVVWAWGGDFK
jgi:zinc protease